MISGMMARVSMAAAAFGEPIPGIVRKRDTPGSLAYPSDPSRFPVCRGTPGKVQRVYFSFLPY